MKTSSAPKLHRDGSRSVKISSDLTPSWLRSYLSNTPSQREREERDTSRHSDDDRTR
jgi:hypothetical protein